MRLRDAFLGKPLRTRIRSLTAWFAKQCKQPNSTELALQEPQTPPRAPRHSAVQHSNFAECKRRLQPGIAASLQLANRVMSRQCSSKTAAEGRAIQTFRTLLGTAKPKQLIMQFRSNGRLCWVLVGGRVAFGTCSWLVPACSHREDTSAPHDE